MNYSDFRVLVVDDEDDLREILVTEFELVGFQVLQARNGKEAYDVVSTYGNNTDRGVDIVVSDIRMPGGSGIELLEKLQGRDNKRPVVFLATGYADVTRTEAIAKGATGFYLKPFSLEEVVRSVCAYVDTKLNKG